MTRVLVVLGTRPEAIKLAPVIHALRSHGSGSEGADVTVCSTGQHREMLAAALAGFEIEPDVELSVMQPGQTPADVVGRLMLAFGPVFEEHRPDWVVVQGDTATVTAGALGAFLHRVRVAHVEAGLRTNDRNHPFPEEINRRVAGVVADRHFAATAGAADNLLAERVDRSEIVLTGNTVIDALRWTAERVADRVVPVEIPDSRRLVLVTAHRRESFGEPFRELCLSLRAIADEHEDVHLVYPVHLNPNVQEPVREILAGHDRISLIEPLGYQDFVALQIRAHLIITDSGGVQEEAPALGKPVLVLREKTERPEAVAAGVVKLVGTDREMITGEARRLLTDADAYAAMARRVDVYGDGLASQRIAESLIDGRLTTPEFNSGS